MHAMNILSPRRKYVPQVTGTILSIMGRANTASRSSSSASIKPVQLFRTRMVGHIKYQTGWHHTKMPDHQGKQPVACLRSRRPRYLCIHPHGQSLPRYCQLIFLCEPDFRTHLRGTRTHTDMDPCEVPISIANHQPATEFHSWVPSQVCNWVIPCRSSLKDDCLQFVVPLGSTFRRHLL